MQSYVTYNTIFSSALKLVSSRLNKEENLKFYGDQCFENVFGHNYKLEAQYKIVSSTIDESSFHQDLNFLKSEVDHRLLNDLIYFKELTPTLEQLTLQSYLILRHRNPNLKGVKVYEGESAFCECYGPQQLYLSQRFVINCLHRHHNPDMSKEENQILYNKCASTHGHEYKIEITVHGKINSDSGFIIDKSRLNELVNKHIVQVYDKTYLNDIVGNTSGEIIVSSIFQQLKPYLPELARVKVIETLKNSFIRLKSEHIDIITML